MLISDHSRRILPVGWRTPQSSPLGLESTSTHFSRPRPKPLLRSALGVSTRHRAASDGLTMVQMMVALVLASRWQRWRLSRACFTLPWQVRLHRTTVVSLYLTPMLEPTYPRPPSLSMRSPLATRLAPAF